MTNGWNWEEGNDEEEPHERPGPAID